eukprot:288183_1
MLHVMSSNDTDKPIEQLINHIKNHQNVIETLTKLRQLLQQKINEQLKQQNLWITTPFDLGNLMEYVMDDILLITNQDSNKDHYATIKHHLSFMRFLTASYSSAFDFNMQKLKQLFDNCIINSSNDIQCWNTLLLFEELLNNFYIRSQLKTFYSEHIEPIMNTYITNKNYLMIAKLYHCFCKYYIKKYNIDITKSKSRCISYLKLNANPEHAIIVVINKLNKLVSLKSGLPCMCLLTLLYDIITVSNESQRTSLLKLHKVKKELSKKTKAVLTDVFNIFASNENGTMNKTDMTRYIIACGADSDSSSKWRINNIFNMFGEGVSDAEHDGNEYELKVKFTANSFCEFYRSACMDRSEYVWQDIGIYGYNCKLELNCVRFVDGYESYEYKEDDMEMREMVRKNEMYHKILVQLLKQMENEFERHISEKILPLIIRLPKSYIMEQTMYNMNESFDVLLGCNNIHCMVYNLMILNGICNDKNINNKWKRLFLKKKGFDYLIKMLIEFYCKFISDTSISNTQSYQLAAAVLMKVMYNFCSFNQVKCIPMCQFLNNMLQIGRCGLDLKDKDIRGVIQNNLVHFICSIAKAKNTEQNITFLKGLPPHIIQLHIEPLIMGYVAQCSMSHDIPNDIIKLLMCFFF